mgnify:CR=1 FL=1
MNQENRNKKQGESNEEMPSFLHQLKSEYDPEIPEGYFENLPDRVMERIRNDEEQAGKNRIIPLKPFAIASIAAAILILIASSIVFIWQPVNVTEPLNNSETLAMEEGYNGFSETELIDVLVVEDMQEDDNSGFQVLEIDFEVLDEEGIIEYLFDAGISEYELAQL